MFRRTSHLVAYWEDAGLRIRSYARGTSAFLRPAEVAVLDALGEWRYRDHLDRLFPAYGRRPLTAFLNRMTRLGMIESSERRVHPLERALEAWEDWSPSASYFHFDTRNMRYADAASTSEILAAQEALEVLPPRIKSARGTHIGLPPFPRRGVFPTVLLSRRSWRRFGRKAMTLHDLSALLGLTWATQLWVRVGRSTRLALKTSPSGGASHSLEAYVAVRDVQGLTRGVYHYAPDTHELVRLKQKWSASWITRGLAGQAWAARAQVVVFITSVFARVQWKYRTPRAYRTILIEAGHFCQTFCLVATWLGLAPFCTASLAERVIEPPLGADGVRESLMYVAGVGTRPPGVRWAPYPDTPETPTTTLPSHRNRRHA